MVRSGVRFFIPLMSSALVMLGVNAGAQGRPEKEKIRIGYAARAVTHSIPFLANEAGLFREEGLQVGRADGRCRVADGSYFGGYRFRYDVGFLADSGVRSEP